MRVLGVDPGLTRCGIGAVDGRPGRPPSLVHADVIRTPAGADIAARLLALEEEIDTWLAEYRPDAVAVERVFSQHNVRTVMGTAQAGAAIEVGGVGRPVQWPPGTLATLRAGEPARVATSLVVREDALTLFGCATDDERDVFVLLQTASGVGPRLALAMLAVFTPD